jgi:membrane protease subunit HflC
VPLHAVLTDQRANLMDEITRRVNAKTRALGVETVDVRIKRADLPQQTPQSVFNRMKTDREREAGQLRAEGDEEKARITATADREVAVIKAEPDAGLKAQVTMGEADAEATRVYAQAFNKDKDFYGFWRRMEAYSRPSAAAVDHDPEPRHRFLPLLQRPHGAAGAKKTREQAGNFCRRRLWQSCNAAGSFLIKIEKPNLSAR